MPETVQNKTAIM